MSDLPTPRPWTVDELRRIGGLDAQTLDDLLTDDEKSALQEHLRLLAEQRRRVEVESREMRMP